ncbi:valine--tRNA ligase-like [Zonotrichia albicollis]|uniref:valine--tRNA ligase-like n=1 Tax=Zonotrichia albicollis TaxID=44394 RepID=UPI003D80E504
MRGRDPREAALVRQWVAFAEGELGTAAAILVGGHKQFGVGLGGFGVFGWRSLRGAGHGGGHLGGGAQTGPPQGAPGALSGSGGSRVPPEQRGRPFLVGDGVTLADVTVLCALLGPFTQVLDPRSRAPFPGVSRWFLSCSRLPQFRAELGDVRLWGGETPEETPRGTPTMETPNVETPTVETPTVETPKGSAGGGPGGVPGGPEPPPRPRARRS